jgi:hypothetical protein
MRPIRGEGHQRKIGRAVERDAPRAHKFTPRGEAARGVIFGR